MGEIERLKKDNEMLMNLIHDMVVGNQSAWIEWKHGKGAKAGMQWIENGLAGPGNIPSSEVSKHYKNPQLYFNEQKAEPFPDCVCGNPSSILWMGRGYCCDEHQKMHREKLDSDAEKETGKIIKDMINQ